MRAAENAHTRSGHPTTIRLQRGFTLIELVIVLAVLGALSAIAVPQLTGLQQEAELNGTAAVISSELGNRFARDLADGDTSDWENLNCSSVSDSLSPALSASSYGFDNGNDPSVAVTIPTYDSSNAQVGQISCDLSE